MENETNFIHTERKVGEKDFYSFLNHMEDNKKTMLFSTERSGEEILDGVIMAFSESEPGTVQKFKEALESKRIVIYDNSIMTVDYIVDKVNILKDFGVVIIDTLPVNSSGDEFKSIVTRLKNISKLRNVKFVLNTQSPRCY